MGTGPGAFGGVNGPSIIFQFDNVPLFGTIYITETLVIGWIIVAALSALVLWLTHGMKRIPTKKQVIAEMLVTTVNNMVRDNMGPRFVKGYAPYIATLFSFSIVGSLVSLLGLRSMTADVNATLAWGLICFVMITYSKFKYGGGLKGYIKGFAEPLPVMFPMNVLSEFVTPISMGFRHFGNIAGGMVITGLIYWALANLSYTLHLYFTVGEFSLGVLQVGIPAVLSVYFDLFSGFMQAFIFSMLTMANVGNCIPDDKR